MALSSTAIGATVGGTACAVVSGSATAGAGGAIFLAAGSAAILDTGVFSGMPVVSAATTGAALPASPPVRLEAVSMVVGLAVVVVVGLSPVDSADPDGFTARNTKK